MKTLAILTVLSMVLSSCTKVAGDPRQPPVPEDEELITTCILQLSDSLTGNSRSYFFKDDDGDMSNGGAYYGPDRFSQSDSLITLQANATYYCRVLLLNETVEPADTVSNEVYENADEHMLFFDPEGSVNAGSQPFSTIISRTGITVVYSDADSKGLPLGLSTVWRTTHRNSPQKLTIVLRHQPGNKDGTFEPGGTDLEVSFSYLVN